MRKLIKLALVAIGTWIGLRWWKRHKQELDAASEAGQTADPADELRRKLAQSRVDDADDAGSPAEASVAERRDEVHEQGRAAIDEMTSSSET